MPPRQPGAGRCTTGAQSSPWTFDSAVTCRQGRVERPLHSPCRHSGIPSAVNGVVVLCSLVPHRARATAPSHARPKPRPAAAAARPRQLRGPPTDRRCPDPDQRVGEQHRPSAPDAAGTCCDRQDRRPEAGDRYPVEETVTLRKPSLQLRTLLSCSDGFAYFRVHAAKTAFTGRSTA